MASTYQSPPAPMRSTRSQTVTYADLMKPDEDWRTLANASERRKIQNRLAQRAYRRNMRDRTKEVENLKKQLQKLQDDKERQGSRDVTPSSDLDAGAHSPSPRPEPAAMLGSTTPMITTSDWTGGVYVPSWSGQTPEPEQQQQQQQLHNLAIQDAEHPLNYDAPSFFPALPGTHEFPAMASPPPMAVAPAGGRSRAVSACSLSSPPVQHQHLRSNSNPPPCFAPRGVSPAPPGAWMHPPAESHDGYDSLQVPISAPPPMLAASPAAYDLYRDDSAVLGLPQPDASFSLDDGQHAHPMAYPSPPDTSDLHHSWTGYEGSKVGRPRSSSTASAALLFEQQQQQQQAHGEAAPARVLPDTNAPLLHLAVSGGHLDTLRFLLQRYDININGRNNQGYTAIQLAVMGGRTDMVALLLEHGADVNTEDLGEGESRLG